MLAFEILSQIVSNLKDDQETLATLATLSHTLRNITQPFLYYSPQFKTFKKFELFTSQLTEQTGSLVRQLDLHMLPHRWEAKMNKSLIRLAPKIPNLQLLNLDLCSQLTNKSLIQLTKCLYDLRILCIDQCTLINDEAIEALIQCCPRIQEIYLGSTHITDASLILMARHLKSLTRVHMPGCEKISEVGVRALTEECKTLKHFDIKDCYNIVGDFRQLISDNEYEDEYEFDEYESVYESEED